MYNAQGRSSDFVLGVYVCHCFDGYDVFPFDAVSVRFVMKNGALELIEWFICNTAI